MKTRQAVERAAAPVGARAVLGGCWVAGISYQIVTRDAPNSLLGPVQAFLVFGLVLALAGTGLALLRASYSSISWAFAAVFCGLLSATLDLPAVPAMAAREM